MSFSFQWPWRQPGGNDSLSLLQNIEFSYSSSRKVAGLCYIDSFKVYVYF